MATRGDTVAISRGVSVLRCSAARTGGASRHDSLKRGREAYERAWRPLEEQIEQVLSQRKDGSVDEIRDWIVSGSRSKSNVASMYEQLVEQTLLPTGLIVGVNSGSSAILWQALASSFSEDRKRRKAILVQLGSKSCPNVRKAVRTVIEGFVGSQNLEQMKDRSDDEGDSYDSDDSMVRRSPKKRRLNGASPSKTTRGKASRLSAEDFQHVEKWYEYTFADQPVDQRPKLVLLLQDFESMEGRVIEPLIRILSSYADRLPIVLLVGIATTSHVFYNAIPRRTTTLLCANTFVVDTGTSALLGLIKELFADWRSPVALGPSVWRDLWLSFSEMHRSIDATLSAMQYLYIAWGIARAEAGDRPELNDDREAVRWERNVYDALAGMTAVQRSYSDQHTFEKSLQDWLSDDVEDRIEALLGNVQRSASSKLLECLPTWADAFADLDVDNPDCAPRDQLRHYHGELVKLDEAKKAGQQNLFNAFAAGQDDTARLSKADRDFASLINDIVEYLRGLFHDYLLEGQTLKEQQKKRPFIMRAKKLRAAFHPSIVGDLSHELLDEKDQASSKCDTNVAFRLLKDAGRTVNLADWYEAFEGHFEGISAGDEKRNGQANVNGLKHKKKGKQTVKNRRQRSNHDADEDAEMDDDDDGSDSDSDDDDSADERRLIQARFLMSLAELIQMGFVSGSARKPEHVNRDWF